MRPPCSLCLAQSYWNVKSDITLIGLGLGLLLMAMPLWYLRHYRTGLVRATLSATARMIVQLYLVGLYLGCLFELDCWWVNLAWGLVMVAVATGSAAQRTQLRPAVLLLPLGIAFLVTSLLITAYFLGLVQGLASAGGEGIEWRELLAARYFIPIFGILLGNMLGVNVLAVSTYYDGLRREQQMMSYLLGNGATLSEATAPLIRSAIIKAFNPCIANMSIMGLVAMPGTMIGQILGGSAPGTAIRYQMMITVITFAASMLSLVITIALARRHTFDPFGRLQDVFKGNEK